MIKVTVSDHMLITERLETYNTLQDSTAGDIPSSGTRNCQRPNHNVLNGIAHRDIHNWRLKK